jgi:hypothetical protein
MVNVQHAADLQIRKVNYGYARSIWPVCGRESNPAALTESHFRDLRTPHSVSPERSRLDRP